MVDVQTNVTKPPFIRCFVATAILVACYEGEMWMEWTPWNLDFLNAFTGNK